MRRASQTAGRAGRQAARADWIPRSGGSESAGTATLGAGPGRGNALTLLSVNVAGLRAVLRSETKSKALQAAVARVRPNVLCLQEHKLQEAHVDEVGSALQDLLGEIDDLEFPTFHFACSVPPARKGYSGVACGVTSTLPSRLINTWKGFSPGDSIQQNLTQAEDVAENEGRLITLEFEDLYVINVYQPNSGSGLKRLRYRVDHWDKKMRSYMRTLEKDGGKPVVLIGDLNVAHDVIDIHNFYPRPNFPDSIPPVEEDKHFVGLSGLKKQAGCTADERISFTSLLKDGGFIDSFRHLHPNATGRFTYWSQRARNRHRNRGLRIDYCVVSSSLCQEHSSCFPQLERSFICDDEDAFAPFSDHAPIGATFLLPRESSI